MSTKALSRHKRTGDLFAIETDGSGNILSTSGPLLTKDLNPEALDYDNYWDPDIRANINGFELLSEAEYKALLKQTGFFVQATISVTLLPAMALRYLPGAFNCSWGLLDALNRKLGRWM